MGGEPVPDQEGGEPDEATNPLEGRVRLCRARQLLAERCLGGGETRDRYAERRARDVVEPDLVAERDRGRIAAVLAADAELEVLAHLAAALARDRDQFADALAIDRDERIDGENALRGVGAEKARGVVAADAEGGLGEIIGAIGEELGG